MNRLNRIIGMLNLMLTEYRYVMWTEDEDKRRNRMECIEIVLKEKKMWEGIRESIRKG